MRSQLRSDSGPRLLFATLCILTVLCADCRDNGADRTGNNTALRLAVTTSTRDSGLLEILLPLFEAKHGVRTDVIAVGTGLALKLGSTGDVDAVLVHARASEDAFIKAGHGVRREEVMYNTFELLGPPSDPAGIRGMEPVEALQQIASAGCRFVSRGDNSGTHMRERSLWRAAGYDPDWNEHVESGQGMGATLMMADNMQAYVLTDNGTYLQFKRKIDLVRLAARTAQMINSYGALVVNPTKNPRINEQAAHAFVDFMISPQAQHIIETYQIDGEQLFHALRLPN